MSAPGLPPALVGWMGNIDAAERAVDAAQSGAPFTRKDRTNASQWAAAVMAEVIRLDRPAEGEAGMAEVLLLTEYVIRLCAQVDALEAERDFWHDRCEPRLFPEAVARD